MSDTPVIVIGAGVIGCGIARALASEGIGVTVVDPDVPGSQASSAAAGMLTPLAEANEASAFLTLLRESLSAFPGLAAELRAETGIDVQLRDEGTLLVALTDADLETIERRFRWQKEAGLPVERISGDEAREMEPALSPDVRLALRFPEDHQVDNRLLARALAQSAEQRGARFHRAAVARVIIEGGSVAGVALQNGDRLPAGDVVVAAGCWSGQIEGLPRPLPVRPVHGQLIALDPGPGFINQIIDSPRVYLVPRRSGRVIAGTTVEEIGYRTEVNADAVERLHAAAREAVPALGDAPVIDRWSGLRPGTPDDLPILGRDPEVEGLHYATGHFRNGILLTPATASILRDSVLRRPPRSDASAFSISRFGNATP